MIYLGTDYNDYLQATAEGSDIRGLYGDDTLVGNIGSDNLQGNVGNDVLYAGAGGGTFFGGRGDDTMFGGQGNDEFWDSHGANWFIFENAGIGGSDIVHTLYNTSTLTITGLEKGTVIKIIDTSHQSCFITVGTHQTIEVRSSQRAGLYDGGTFIVNGRTIDIPQLDTRVAGTDIYTVV